MNATDVVIEKIKKLLRLAGSSEAHEASLALTMAQKLMAEHRLTSEDVEAGEIVTDSLTSVVSFSASKDWELRLYRGVSEAFGCGLMFSKGRSGHTTKGPYGRRHAKYVFIGGKTDVTLSVYAAHVLQRQLVRCQKGFIEGCRAGGIHDRTQLSGEVDAYCRGWVEVALTKVAKLVPNPARAKAIEKHIEATKVPDANVPVTGREGSADARRLGQADARDVELNRPMDGAARKGLNAPSPRALGSGS